MNATILPIVILLAAWQLLLLAVVAVKTPSVRRICGMVILFGFCLTLGTLIAVNFNWSSFFVSFFGVYQIVNIGRVIENRLALPRLRRQVLRAGIVFTLLLIAIPYLYLLSDTAIDRLYCLYAAASALFGAMLLVSTVYNIYRSRPAKQKTFYSDEELPTVSVLIPARNEDAELSDCIYNVIKNDYPKLEIIVLDDCSYDRSSDIIKRFAHDGVRFIQGDAPREGWLAKNQAYETLAEAASGDWLLFMGVDVRLSPTTIRALISHALASKMSMLSVLPKRTDPSLITSLLMPLRYWWELSLPRGLIGRTAVLSTTWLIERSALKKAGGLEAVAKAVTPESYYARELYKKGKYQFIRSSQALQFMTSKKLSDQYETAVRTRYPQLHRHLEQLALTTLFMTAFWLLPFVLALREASAGNGLLFSLFALCGACLVAAHMLIVFVSNPRHWLVAIVNLPFLQAQELILTNLSGYKYEFSEVEWKGRNICYPVMHITKELPKA